MATPADGNVTAVVKNEVFVVINFVDIYYEKSASRNAFLRKKKTFPSRILLKASNIKTLKGLK